MKEVIIICREKLMDLKIAVADNSWMLRETQTLALGQELQKFLLVQKWTV